MAFSFFKWLLKRTEATETEEQAAVGSFLDTQTTDAVAGLEVYLQKMAFWACVRRIGDAVGAVEWETYRRGKKVKAKEYWSWNYGPNPNQTRKQFFDKLIGQLFLDQEALIVETGNGCRYVADGFSTEEHLSGDIYRDVSSDGEGIPGAFSSRDVLHLTLEGAQVRRMMTAVAQAEGQLLRSAAAAYIRKAGKHGILHISDIAEADEDFNETYNELINRHFKDYFTAENAVLPLFDGYSYEDDKTGESKAASASTTRDIRALMDDIFELTATALGIPSSVAAGKAISDEDFRAFLTSPVQPLVNMIAQEMNRKIYGQTLVFSGTYIAPNLAAVQYHDVFDIANPIDKLIGSGAFCVNDILIRLGMNRIDEPWAYQHWMTKNYSPADELLKGTDSGTGGDGTIPGNMPGKEKEETENG